MLDPLNTKGRITVHTTEHGEIRKLVQDFIKQKKIFSERSQDVRLDLPASLAGLSIPGRVREGELTIKRFECLRLPLYPLLIFDSDEMRKLFENSIGGVISLLKSQITKVRESKIGRVRVSRTNLKLKRTICSDFFPERLPCRRIWSFTVLTISPRETSRSQSQKRLDLATS